MPPLFGGEATRERLRTLGATAPLTIHLKQEVDRLDRVVALVGATLADLRLAIAGTIALSDELLEALDALYCARVPKRWAKISWEASGSGSWFSGLLARHDQLHRWLTSGRPKTYWLTGFFNPQAFLTAGEPWPAEACCCPVLALLHETRCHAFPGLCPAESPPHPPLQSSATAAVRQEAARRQKWAVDSCLLTSEVTKFADEGAVKAAADEGVLVHGLYLEGAAWSMKEGKLVDAEPKVGG